MKPLIKLDEHKTPDGILQLFKRGVSDYIIKLDNQILMNSYLSLTERVLATAACNAIKMKKNPKIMVSGLGMGHTLQETLNSLNSNAKITVVELNPIIVEWCKKYLADINGDVLNDSRVELVIGDAAEFILMASIDNSKAFDAIILDMYEGTTEANRDPFHSFYSLEALKVTRDALVKKGVLAVWTEANDSSFKNRFERAGFNITSVDKGKGGPRHIVYLGIK